MGSDETLIMDQKFLDSMDCVKSVTWSSLVVVVHKVPENNEKLTLAVD